MISYFFKNGIEYGKTQGTSYRVGNSIKKKGQKHIGRVINKDKSVFYSKDKGFFIYNEADDSYSEVNDGTYDLSPLKDLRKKEKLLLDFGDVYFLDQLMKSIGYDKVIESIGYKNIDSLKALAIYYIVSEKANVHASIWKQGSIASILYPSANLNSQRISDLLVSLGEQRKQQNYFKAHIDWIKNKVSVDPAIIVDSTGLPNDIDTYLKDISNHNGKISRESRMTCAIQRDSGYPLLYRLHPGNIVDASTLQRTIVTLSMYDVKTDIALLDAGYCSNEIIDSLYDNDIDFVTRLPERNTSLYKQIKEECLSTLQRKENLIEYNGRFIYIKACTVKVGKKSNHTAYAYLGLDIQRANDEIYKASEKQGKKKKNIEEIHDIYSNAGLFVLLSSLPYSNTEIVPVYYVRQYVEQYFDISKGLSRLTPLRGHSEEAIYGHLMMCQIAATINLYLQKRMNQSFDNREKLLMHLRNQKAIVYQSKIITSEPQSIANEYYDKFELKSPISLIRKGNELIPEYDIKI